MEKKTLDSFVCGLIEAAKAIKKENPSVIIAPINGAVSLIDLLYIVEPEIANLPIEYIPASSALVDVKNVIKTWTKNYLADQFPSEGMHKMVIIDEVVSGNSSVRVYHSIREGINAFARELDQDNKIPYSRTKDRISYKTIGLKDMKCPIKSNQYKEMMTAKIAEHYPVDQIVTMDRPEYRVVDFKSEMKDGKLLFYPEIESLTISLQYLNLMESVAKIVGADPALLTPANLNKISNSTRYLKK